MFANRQVNPDTSAEFKDKSARPASLVSVVPTQASRAPEAKIVHPNQPCLRSQ